MELGREDVDLQEIIIVDAMFLHDRTQNLVHQFTYTQD